MSMPCLAETVPPAPGGTTLTYIRRCRSIFTCSLLPRLTTFSAIWPKYWTADEFGEFCAWLAVNPQAGDVIPQSAGCRKVRWTVGGRGKRSGVRVIYINRLTHHKVWLLTMYSKAMQRDVERKVLKKLRESIDG